MAQKNEESARSKNAQRRQSRAQDFAFDPDRDSGVMQAPVVEAYPIDDYYTAKSGISAHVDTSKLPAASSSAKAKSNQKTKSGSSPNKSTKEKERPPPILFEQGRSSSKKWPSGLCEEVVDSFKKSPNEAAGRKFLSKRNWTKGMQDALFKSCSKIPIRFFVGVCVCPRAAVVVPVVADRLSLPLTNKHSNQNPRLSLPFPTLTCLSRRLRQHGYQ